MNDSVFQVASIVERLSLRGKSALITGGAQGIGRALAHGFAEAGANVALVDLNLAAAEIVAGELEAKGVRAIALKADVTREDQVRAAVEHTVAAFGSLTIGVNNAGVAQWQSAEDVTDADWNRMFGINLKGVFLCCQAEAQVMLGAGYGKIINTASMSGSIVNTPQHQSLYNASKAGVIHLTRSLAAEWAKRGVRVNSISPGYTRTALVEDFLETPEGQAAFQVWMNMTPMGKMAEVTDLQGAAVFLASSASDFVTGLDLVIDGGYSCW